MEELLPDNFQKSYFKPWYDLAYWIVPEEKDLKGIMRSGGIWKLWVICR